MGNLARAESPADGMQRQLRRRGRARRGVAQPEVRPLRYHEIKQPPAMWPPRQAPTPLDASPFHNSPRLPSWHNILGPMDRRLVQQPGNAFLLPPRLDLRQELARQEDATGGSKHSAKKGGGSGRAWLLRVLHVLSLGHTGGARWWRLGAAARHIVAPEQACFGRTMSACGLGAACRRHEACEGARVRRGVSTGPDQADTFALLGV